MADRVAAGLIVANVEPDSPAHAAGIEPGDAILAVDGRPVSDELAFRFLAASDESLIGVRRDGREMAVRLLCTDGEPAGIEFADLLADGVRTCNNRCVFCFIHQMPRGMRRSLYLKDDDYRLSFVHGNYITLTNLSDAEFDRIVEQRLSPLYVSVHATDPELRGRLLGRRGDVPIMPRLNWLATHGIDAHAQIVLCPGLNDGPALEETLSELSGLHPSVSGVRNGVQSVAIVPVGLTRYRDRLPHLRLPDAPYAANMLRMMGLRQRAALKTMGTRFVWLSDEWYYLAGRSVPGRTHYEGFPQLDDGVGTSRLFIDELAAVTRRLPASVPDGRRGVAVTGLLAAAQVSEMCARFSSVDGVSVSCVAVANEWFGGSISATGLLTARDIASALGRSGGDGVVFVPDICLREGAAFLDDATPADLSAAVGRPVRIVPSRPRGLAEALGLTSGRSFG